MSARMPVRRVRCRGQALAEFIIGATLFLIPVFLIIPLLGKYADMKASVIQAARFNAWERTVYYGGAASSDTDDPWDSHDRTQAEIQADMERFIFSPGKANTTLWKDRAGVNMVENTSNSLSNGNAPGTANAILKPIISAISAIGPFTLEMEGLYTGTVTLNSAPITPIGQSVGTGAGAIETWQNLDLAISDSNVILVNGWSPNGPDAVKKQVKGLTPTSILDNSIIDAARWLLVPFTPELAPTVLETGKIEPDVVPPDRLN